MHKFVILLYVKKNATLIKNDCAVFGKKCAALLWFASGFVREVYRGAFCQMRCDFCQHTAIQRNAALFHGKSAAILELWCFLELQRTQRDKRGARYAVLISAAAARLLHSFRRIPYSCMSCVNSPSLSHFLSHRSSFIMHFALITPRTSTARG